VEAEASEVEPNLKSALKTLWINEKRHGLFLKYVQAVLSVIYLHAGSHWQVCWYLREEKIVILNRSKWKKKKEKKKKEENSLR
jgi:hypothetical protein